jgi:hypothetical protein
MGTMGSFPWSPLATSPLPPRATWANPQRLRSTHRVSDVPSFDIPVLAHVAGNGGWIHSSVCCGKWGAGLLPGLKQEKIPQACLVPPASHAMCQSLWGRHILCDKRWRAESMWLKIALDSIQKYGLFNSTKHCLAGVAEFIVAWLAMAANQTRPSSSSP